MKKMMKLMLVAALFAGGAAACGSDDDDKSPTTQADTEVTTADDDEGTTSAEVAAYCADAEEVATALKDVMSDPTKGDLVELSKKATDLTASAAKLIAANPDQVDEINACSKKITDVAGG